jgi:hypothetical protein
VFEYASAWGLRERTWVDVNSIDDKQHGTTTLHSYSLALNLDTDGDRPADLKSLHGWLARYLPLEYDVVLESDHVHIEYDLISRAPNRAKAAAAPPATPV